jgi:hypothetical protein
MDAYMNQIVKDNICIVLGAGASKEFGLPTGKELAEKITGLLSTKTEPFNAYFTDSEFNQAVETAIRSGLVSGKQSIFTAARLIRDNLPIAPSIDNFLHTHRQNTDLVWLGKLSIIFTLLRAEASSILVIDRSNSNNRLDLKKASVTWIGQLFTQLLVAGNFDAFANRLKKISFVSFNYDRCVHQFIAFASKQYFDLTDTQVNHLLSNLNVHYVYGSIGEYDFRGGNESNYGHHPTAYNSLGLIGKIQTFTEGRDAKDREEIRHYIDGAREVYFLGFGFNKLNIERIVPPEGYACNSVFGTTLGQPELAASQIQEELRLNFAKFLIDANGERVRYDSIEPVLKHVPCRDLIWECHRNFQTAPD